MNPILLLTAYTQWHYGNAFVSMFVLWMNGLWFTTHFFSIFLLLKTLFSPWKRLTETYKGGLNLDNILELIIVNTLMRLVGAFFRSVIIVLGLVALAVVLISGALFFIIWFFAPIILFVLFFNSLALLL